MRKYIFLTVLLVTGILAALHITAFAGEVTWADTSDSYYDQLTGDAIQERFDKIVEDLVDTTEGLAPAQRVAWWDNWLAANNAYNGAASSNQDYVLPTPLPGWQ